MVLTQRFERLRQKVRNRASRCAEPNASGEPLDLALNVLQGLFRIGQQPTRSLDQQLACCRWPDMSTPAREERCPDALFQFRDVETDRGRRQMQRSRRIGE
ncbi:hypothetical protein NK8_66560 (plasmid) [Caballeronia sp. NK8]|nr:hypothetical protein NK8_66560 [Caballeronia sp. NK8]